MSRAGIAAAVIVSAALAACDSDSTGPDGGDDTVTIEMRDNSFSPSSRTVDAGTTVRWVNAGNTAHNTTAGTGTWQSGNLTPGDDFEVTLQNPGTYQYSCTLHEGMNGTIVVN